MKSKAEKHKGKNPPHKIKHECAACGKEFSGGPAAKYCPSCRKKVSRSSWGADYGEKQSEETLAMFGKVKI